MKVDGSWVGFMSQVCPTIIRDALVEPSITVNPAMQSSSSVRLKAYFATAAPVCIIARRGPASVTQLIHWDTANDIFTPGQWIQAKVGEATLNSSGTHMAIMIKRAAGKFDERGKFLSKSFICRPPYLEPLELYVSTGMWTPPLAITPDDFLVCPTGCEVTVNAKNACVFTETKVKDFSTFSRDHAYKLESSAEAVVGLDQAGREVRLEAGCIYGPDGLLYDANPNQYEADITAPDWAKDW